MQNKIQINQDNGKQVGYSYKNNNNNGSSSNGSILKQKQLERNSLRSRCECKSVVPHCISAWSISVPPSMSALVAESTKGNERESSEK